MYVVEVEVSNAQVLPEHLPVRSSNKGIGRSHDRRRTKVPKFDLAGLRQQDVAGFHVPKKENKTLRPQV